MRQPPAERRRELGVGAPARRFVQSSSAKRWRSVLAPTGSDRVSGPAPPEARPLGASTGHLRDARISRQAVARAGPFSDESQLDNER